jgi:hypothetical protein
MPGPCRWRRGRCLRWAVIASLSLVASSLPAASAEADLVTIGSPLDREFSRPLYELGATATWVDIRIADREVWSAAPVDGTIVRWRLKGAFTGGAFSLQVIRPLPHDYSVTVTSAPEIPDGEGTLTFTTNLPISAGELIAIETDAEGETVGTAPVADPDVIAERIAPALEQGSAGSASLYTTEDGAELGYDADIEYTPPIGPSFPPPPPPVAAAPTEPTIDCTVPRLIGRSLRAARSVLTDAGCTLGEVVRREGAVARSARIRSQHPKAGTVSPPGEAVRVALGAGRGGAHHPRRAKVQVRNRT